MRTTRFAMASVYSLDGDYANFLIYHPSGENELVRLYTAGKRFIPGDSVREIYYDLEDNDLLDMSPVEDLSQNERHQYGVRFAEYQIAEHRQGLKQERDRAKNLGPTASMLESLGYSLETMQPALRAKYEAAIRQEQSGK